MAASTREFPSGRGRTTMKENGRAPALTLTRLAPQLQGSAPSPAVRERGDQPRLLPGLVGEGFGLDVSYFHGVREWRSAPGPTAFRGA